MDEVARKYSIGGMIGATVTDVKTESEKVTLDLSDGGKIIVDGRWRLCDGDGRVVDSDSAASHDEVGKLKGCAIEAMIRPDRDSVTFCFSNGLRLAAQNR